MARTFQVTFDYLCPFARIANEVVVDAIEDGAGWDVSFVPFSLAQTKVSEDETPVWERPDGAEGTRGVLALQWGIAVRDEFSEAFGAYHRALFDARHSDAADINEEATMRSVAETVGLDPDEVSAVVATGQPLATLGEEHTEAVKRHGVFGVPTFIDGDDAVFVRLMDRHCRGDVERILDMLAWTNVNEFKRTRIPR
ncbi:MAG TPA: DsbA family protein [Acidimicrobiia bacterium]|jgi:protein-disulfide isomerase-like protein with CxxC motif